MTSINQTPSLKCSLLELTDQNNIISRPMKKMKNYFWLVHFFHRWIAECFIILIQFISFYNDVCVKLVFRLSISFNGLFISTQISHCCIYYDCIINYDICKGNFSHQLFFEIFYLLHFDINAKISLQDFNFLFVGTFIVIAVNL